MRLRRLSVRFISLMLVVLMLGAQVMAETVTENTEPTDGSTVTETSASGTTGDPGEEEGLGGFVNRLYSTVLGRTCDPEGYADWCEQLSEGTKNGREVAEGFFESNEFLSKTLTDEEYLAILYRLFFNREPDPEGLATWLGKLSEGVSRTDIRSGFYDSSEWENTCLSYRIRSGGNGTATEVPEPTEGMITFVSSLYSECLDREPDEWGLNNWTKQLSSQEVTGKQVAYGFFFSQEFLTKAQTMETEDLIRAFYLVFLNREPDEYGLKYWSDKYNWGIGVEGLFTGFADSAEFSDKCKSYGVICGDHIDVGNLEIDSEFMEFASWGSIRLGIDRLNSVSELYPHNFYTQFNVQSATTTSERMTISDREIAVIERFAATHFQPSWSAGQKAAYTLWWIHMNVRYANSSAAWSAMAGCGYAEAVFERRVGQCAQYNGALIEMMCWLGFDANMILGSRGYSGGLGAQHFWGEVTVNGEVYVMEAGNYGDYPYWLYFCAAYNETRKYIKNTVLMG